MWSERTTEKNMSNLIDRLHSFAARYAGCSAVLFILAALIYYFSCSIIWMGDDIIYQYIFPADDIPFSNDFEKVKSVGDVAVSQWHHYFTTNGRTVAHILVQVFCGLLGQQWFAVFNASAYVILTLVVLRCAGIRHPRFADTASVAMMLLLCMPTVMGPSCQIGYIWMAILSLLFILLFLNPPHCSIISATLLFVFGILAGNGQETYNIGIGGALIAYFIYHKAKIKASQWILTISFGIGALLLCLCPAALHRAQTSTHDSGMLFIMLVLSFAPIALAVIAFYLKLSAKRSFRQMIAGNKFFLVVLAISLIFNIAIGIKGNRQFFGVYLMSIILIMRLLPRHTFNKFFLSIFALLTLVFIYIQYSDTKNQRIVLANVETLYSESPDGIIYADLRCSDIFDPFAYSWSISQPVQPDRYIPVDYLLLSRHNGNKPDIKIYPSFLKGRLNTKIETQVVNCEEQNMCILIRTHGDSRRFIVDRKLFGLLPLSSKEINIMPIVETLHYDAFIYSMRNPVIVRSTPYISD